MDVDADVVMEGGGLGSPDGSRQIETVNPSVFAQANLSTQDGVATLLGKAPSVSSLAPLIVSPETAEPFRGDSSELGSAMSTSYSTQDDEAEIRKPRMPKQVQVVIPPREIYPPLPYSTAQSGLVYDIRMRFHAEPIESDDDIHPEEPRRIWKIFQILVDSGLAYDPSIGQRPSPNQLFRIEFEPATYNQVTLAHTNAHWEFVKKLRG